MADSAPDLTGTGLRNLPAPWSCKGVQIYTISWTTSSAEVDHSIIYSPLEAQSDYATSPASGRPVPGTHHIHILRYSDSPAGPYDELALVRPYAYDVEIDGRRVEKIHSRITRIYVTSKDSVWNGRYHYNMPKHHASFEWADLPDGSKRVKVFPHDHGGDKTESTPSRKPFFQLTFKTIPWVPAFPATTKIYRWLGQDTGLVSPPLPQGEAKELVGTSRWAKGTLDFSTWRANVGWFDLRQGECKDGEDGQEEADGELANFWPGMKRWVLGLRLDDVSVYIPPAEKWDPPRTAL